MHRQMKWLIVTGVVVLVALLAAVPALADTITGRSVVIDADTDDDIYVFAEDVTIAEGVTVNGDAIIFARSLTMNGTITGDLIFGGAWAELNGAVQDDMRMGGYALLVRDGGQVGDDLNFGGFGLQMDPGTQIGGDAYIGAGQAALAAVTGDVFAGLGSLRINGTVGGSVNADVGGVTGIDPASYMQQPDLPRLDAVPAGLSFGSEGRVEGDLSYTAPQEGDFAANVAGVVSFTRASETGAHAPSVRGIGPGAGVPFGVFGPVRFVGFFLGTFVMMVLVGLLMQRFAPDFLEQAGRTLRERALASFGTGLLGYLVWWLVIGVLVVLVILLIIPLLLSGAARPVLNVITIGATLAGSSFSLVTRWIAPLLIAIPLGALIVGLFSKDRKAPFWALVAGALTVSLVMAIPVFGRWFVTPLVHVFGLGAVILALWPRKAAPAAAVQPSGPEADSAPLG